MSNNSENDRTVSTSKMYPIDLAPPKITIVKTVSNTEVKMTHLIPGPPKTTGGPQILSHTGSVGIMRPTAQIISSGITSQPQMIVSGSPILQGTQIVSQGSQLIGQGSQLIGPGGQLLSPPTQIISQGSQLSAQVSNGNSSGVSNVQANVSSSILGSATQVLNVGGLVTGAANLVVNSSRTLPPNIRVLPPLPHNNTRPAVLSNVSVSTGSGVLLNKTVTSHVPRGLAAGASLAVRPVTPNSATQSPSNQAWTGSTRGVRGPLVYGARATVPRATPPRAPSAPLLSAPAPVSVALQSPPAHSAIVTLPTPAVHTSSAMSNALRGVAPRSTTTTPSHPMPVHPTHTAPTHPSPAQAAQVQPPHPTPAQSGTLTSRPLPLLQRNYSPKVVGIASVAVRPPVGNSAPPQLYYEVPRPPSVPASHSTGPQPHPTGLLPHTSGPLSHPQGPMPLASHSQQLLTRPLTPYVHAHNQTVSQVSIVSAVQNLSENRPPPTSGPVGAPLPRPTILRKRDIDGSPSKTAGVGPPGNYSRLEEEGTGWEDVATGGPGSGGSTTISASSSPAPDDEPEPNRVENDVSPRKKPRKQMLNNEVRQCEFPAEEKPVSPPPVVVNPPPKRPQLSSSYVCGWRATALHFARPADVRRREPRARDILAIAGQRHALNCAEGWKVHHLTAQMDDLVSLEADVGDQLAGVLRALETASGRAMAALQPHSHTLLELLKGNIQRSKIVCEGIQEARDDILRVFTHRNIVAEILSRQADKRCFRKHRLQS